jgi:hypothetical protein
MGLGELSLSSVVPQSFPLELGQSPTTPCALPVNVLLAHMHPYSVRVRQHPPLLADLGGLQEGIGIEEAEDLLGELGR